MNFNCSIFIRQVTRLSRHSHLQRNQSLITTPFNNQSVRNFLIFGKSFSSDPIQKGPLIVTIDEPPVDTSKYSNVLITLNGYDPAIVTSYYHFVDQAARNMKFDVPKKFNLKTEGVNVTLANPPHFFREKKMKYTFKNHGRMIQIGCIPSEKTDIFIQYIQNNIPAGVSLGIELQKWEDFVSPPSERDTSTEIGQK